MDTCMLLTHVGLDMTWTVTVGVSLGRTSQVACLSAGIEVREVLSMARSCMSVWWTLTSASVLPLGPEASVHILLFQLYHTHLLQGHNQSQTQLLRFSD